MSTVPREPDALPCRWGRCSGEVPATGGACSACGQVQPGRGVPFVHPKDGTAPRPRFVEVDPDALPAIAIAAPDAHTVTITVPASEPSSWALAHRVAACLYDAKARDVAAKLLGAPPPPDVGIKRGRQGFCVVVEVKLAVTTSGHWRALWIERAMTIVPGVARDQHGRPTHRAVYR